MLSFVRTIQGRWHVSKPAIVVFLGVDRSRRSLGSRGLGMAGLRHVQVRLAPLGSWA